MITLVSTALSLFPLNLPSLPAAGPPHLMKVVRVAIRRPRAAR